MTSVPFLFWFVISLIVSLISASSFENVVVYLLEAIYKFLFIRYIYLYKEYIDNKDRKEDVKAREVKEEKPIVEKKVSKPCKSKKDDASKEEKK